MAFRTLVLFAALWLLSAPVLAAGPSGSHAILITGSVPTVCAMKVAPAITPDNVPGAPTTSFRQGRAKLVVSGLCNVGGLLQATSLNGGLLNPAGMPGTDSLITYTIGSSLGSAPIASTMAQGTTAQLTTFSGRVFATGALLSFTLGTPGADALLRTGAYTDTFTITISPNT